MDATTSTALATLAPAEIAPIVERLIDARDRGEIRAAAAILHTRALADTACEVLERAHALSRFVGQLDAADMVIRLAPLLLAEARARVERVTAEDMTGAARAIEPPPVPVPLDATTRMHRIALQVASPGSEARTMRALVNEWRDGHAHATAKRPPLVPADAVRGFVRSFGVANAVVIECDEAPSWKIGSGARVRIVADAAAARADADDADPAAQREDGRAPAVEPGHDLPDPHPGETWIHDESGERVTVQFVDEPRHACSGVTLRFDDGRSFKYTLRSLRGYRREIEPGPAVAREEERDRLARDLDAARRRIVEIDEENGTLKSKLDKARQERDRLARDLDEALAAWNGADARAQEVAREIGNERDRLAATVARVEALRDDCLRRGRNQFAEEIDAALRGTGGDDGK